MYVMYIRRVYGRAFTALFISIRRFEQTYLFGE